MKILIVEDIVLTAMALRNTLQKGGHAVTSLARSFSDARKSVISDPPDLALIDIILEGSEANGVETARELYGLRPMPIIYLTANSESTQFLEAQQTHPAAYLLKPFNDIELLFNVELAYNNFQSKTRSTPLEGVVMLPSLGGLDMVSLDKVLYLEADGSYTQVVMLEGRPLTISTGLRHLESYFDKPYFFRTSRFHIVNLHYINRLKDNKLELSDKKKTILNVPDARKKELLNRLTVVRTKPSTKN